MLEAESPIVVQTRKNIDEAVGLSAVTVDIRLSDGASLASDAVAIATARTKDATSSTGTANAAPILLAERHLFASELLATIVLDDSLAINPADTLSVYQRVAEARIVSTSRENNVRGRSDAKGMQSRHVSVVVAAPLL